MHDILKLEDFLTEDFHTEGIQAQCLCSEQLLHAFWVQRTLPLESEAHGSSPDIRYCSCGSWATQDAKKTVGKWLGQSNVLHESFWATLFTASAASKDVLDDRIHAKTKGDVYKSFGKNRTNTEESALIFQGRIPEQKIKTFSDMQMYSRMKVTQREVPIKADQMLFVHAVHC